MAQAKSSPFKFLWTTVLVLSLSMTLVSLVQTVRNYIAEPVHVIVEKRDAQTMTYPPLKICFDHWMQWVNFTEAREMNFTKQEILFGLSYLSEIFVEEEEQQFDLEVTKKSFYEKLRSRNIFLLEDFYAAIAFKKRQIIENLQGDPPQYEVGLEVTDVTSLCYKFSEAQIRDIIVRLNSRRAANRTRSNLGRVIFVLSGDISANRKEITTWLSQYEYTTYIKETYEGTRVLYDRVAWIFSTDLIPFWLIPNGYEKIGEVINGGRPMHVTVKVTAESLKRTVKDPCHIERNWITSNKTCSLECKRKYVLKMNGGYLSEKMIAPQCNKIYLIANATNGTSTKDVMAERSQWKTDLQDYKKVQYKSEYKSCLKTCEQEAGCDQWSYTFGYTELPYIVKEIALISYPSQVIVMKEKNVQTWENFVGSIGGLLGVWTGASILTFLQLIYLCCWYDGKLP